MLFHSLDYAVLLITVWIITWGFLRSHLQLRNFVLLSASYVFYCTWDWRFAGLLAFSTLLDFVIGRAIFESELLRRKRQFLAISLVGNLGVLGFFKYYNFFLGSLNQLLSRFGILALPGYVEVILPLGISFYTQLLTRYLLRKAETNKKSGEFCTFCCLFPTVDRGSYCSGAAIFTPIRKIYEI